jgi:hypothetical protein
MFHIANIIMNKANFSLKPQKLLVWSWIKDKIFDKQIISKHNQIINDDIGLEWDAGCQNNE